MDGKRLKKNMGDTAREMLLAFVIVAVLMLALYAYCGIWPPMVVIESGSMEHPPDMWTKKSYIGVIDTGDMVFVKSVNGNYGTDVVTYVQGEGTGHWKYGSYGDVIVYQPNGLKYRGDGTPVIPIIHRLVVWLELNTSRVNPNFNGIDYANYSFDVPSLGIYDSTDSFTIRDYGYQHENVTIRLDSESGLMRYYEGMNMVPHGGYITMGDNNAPAYDQPLSGGYEPILPDWIIGKAWGELPWFGLIKLWASGADVSRVAPNSWNGLYGTIIILLLFPFTMDFIVPRFRMFLKGMKHREYLKNPQSAEEEKIPEMEAYPPPDRGKPPGTFGAPEDRPAQEENHEPGPRNREAEEIPIDTSKPN